MKEITATEAVTYDVGCFDCDNQSCWACGHDVFPMPYCEKQPVIDRYEKIVQCHFYSPKCKTCKHKMSEITPGPCSRCIHAQ